MKRKLSLIVAILILVLPIFCYAVFKAPNLGAVYATTKDKPVVMIFSMPLCSECQKLKVVSDKMEARYNSELVFEKINAGTMDQKTIEEVKKYNVKVVPTIIFFDKRGHIVARKEGAMPEAAFDKQIQELID